MRKSLAVGLTVGLVAAVGFALPAQAISSTTADLSVFHGIPDLPVDVYVNGDLTLDDFQPGDMAGPLDLPAGDYTVAITAADAADDSSPVLGPVTLTLAANTSYTAVAHLKADGTPTVTAFTNDVSTTAAGQGRLTVRHVAAAPAVDVLAGGSAVITNLTNPNEKTLDLPAGTISAAVAATGTTTPVVGPADVTIKDGTLTVVYAWGSLEDDNLALAIQEVPTGHTNPDGVPSGTAGYAADRDTQTQLAWTLAGVTLLAGAIGAVIVIIRRRATARS